MTTGSEITLRLRDWSQGDHGALDQVAAAVYDELSAIARRQLRGESPGHTLDTSAVVHEAYLCLRDADGIEWKNRQHFFGVAGRIMRRVLVRHARDRMALKRGAGARHVPVSQAMLFTDSQIEQIVALDELMNGLDVLGPRCRSVVESRVFACPRRTR